MTDDLIQRLAREAGCWPVPGEIASAPKYQDGLHRFAALVVEECAQTVEASHGLVDPSEFAAAIRAKFKEPTNG